MATDVAIPVTTEGVSNVMGIPSNGEEIVVHTKRGTSNRTYTISLLEQNLEDLTMGDDFRKTFLIFACATLLAPNSKLEGMHDLWDTIWDGDVGVQKNWLQFVFHYIENGIREYRKNQPTYIRSCLIFLQLFYMTKFYMPSVMVDVTMLLLTAWSDDLIKRQLSAEIATFGGYGHVHTQQLPESVGHSHAPVAGGPSSARDDSTEVVDVFIDSKAHIRIVVIQARMIETSENMLRLASSLAQDVAELRSCQFGSQYRCSATLDQPAGQVQEEPASMSGDIQHSVEEFVEQPYLPSAQHSPAERHDSTIDHSPPSLHPESHDQSYPYPHLEVVQEVHNVKPCLKLFPKISHTDRLVVDFALDEEANPSEVVCDMHGMFSTSFELASLNGGRWVNNILFILVCKNNHWHLHVLNILAGHIEILSSLPLRKGNYISASSRRLYDCGIFALKYMEYWNAASLTQAVAEEKMHVYRLQMVVTLLLNEANNVRENIIQACGL
ncbi:hypothetical protein CK203_064368 [Vitis vinifera]|uniref:Ubiquitin-like protease family profile domain-containing protein n=1 Tax=Vitis vinifera TaxID=29760 RepID=A0A438FPF8_VITVI|nr:hypothetical protein CK203_064368 [Vitis vinifera]